MTQQDTCPLCHSVFRLVESTPSGKKPPCCSAGFWDPRTRPTHGCPFVKWIKDSPERSEGTCLKCGSSLILQTTRGGKKIKKCLMGCDREARDPNGCEYVDWMGRPHLLDKECPQCQSKLVLVTVASGRKLKKCSTAKWDRKTRTASGCTYVQWINDRVSATIVAQSKANGDESGPDFEF